MITSSNTRKRKGSWNSIAAFLVLMCTVFSLNAQNVNVSTVVRPPYGFDIEEYAYNMTVILTAAGETPDVALRVSIKGNNGIKLVSGPDFAPFTFFELFPGTPYMAVGSELEEYFDLDNLMISGISRQMLEENGLPEGRYQVCISVHNDLGEQLSPQNSGCSNYFQVSALDPPRIIHPICGHKILNTQSQNIVFTWSNPPGSAPNLTDYTLRIVEMANPDLSAEEALRSTAIPFFEEEIQGRTSFFYGPAQPFLERGKKYAFEVVAENLELMLRFENSGRSEACWFQFGDAFAFEFDPTDFDVEEEGPTFQPAAESIVGLDDDVEEAPWLNFSITSVSGKLFYYFNDDATYVSANALTNSTGWPLANMPVRFIVKYYMENDAWENSRRYFLGTSDLNDISEYLTIPNDLVVGSTVTGEDGSFFLPFNLTEEMGQLDDQVQLGHYETGRRGKLYRAIFLEVQDPHYLQPPNPLFVKPNEFNEVGTLKSKVRSYNLNVQLESSVDPLLAYGANVLDDIEVSLIRVVKPALIPENEVRSSIEENEVGQLGMVTVGKSVSKDGGKVAFKWVIYNKGSNDRYFIRAESAESIDHDWYYPMTLYQYTEEDYYEDNDGGHVFNQDVYGSVYNDDMPVRTRAFKLSVKPRDPLVYGKVKDHRGQGVPGAKVKLIMEDIKKVEVDPDESEAASWIEDLLNQATDVAPTFKDVPDFKLVGEMISDAEGDFSIRFNPEHKKTVEGAWYRAPLDLLGIKDGYKTNFQYVNVEGGMTSLVLLAKRYKKDINLQPRGLLAGKVTSEERQAVMSTVYVINELGEQVSLPVATSRVYPTRDFNTGEWHYPEFSEFELQTPSGDMFLVVDPDNEYYFDDTVALRIKKNGTTTIEHVAQLKGHRVEVTVINAKYKGQMYNAMDPPDDLYVHWAKVSVPGRTGELLTNSKGLARLDPFTGGNQFTIRVEGPNNLDFETAEVDVSDSHISRDYKKVTVWLQPAARISGAVSVQGRTQFLLPLEGAEVRLAGAGGYDVITQTDSEGKYVLRNVPLGSGITISASKPGSNLIGEAKELDITSAGLADMNFVLKYPPTIDLTTIWGFPAAIDEAREDNGKWIISGSISQFPENNGLSTDHPYLAFHEITVRPKSASDMTAVPVKTTVPLDENKWGMTYDPTLQLVQVNKKDGLELFEISPGVGAINGKIYIDASNSFADPNLSFTDTLFLTQGGLPGKIASFSASGSTWSTDNILLKDQNGGIIDLNWMGFDISSTTDAGRINGDKVEWDAVLHTNLNDVQPSDLSIEIGKMSIVGTGVVPIYSTKAISMKLEEWDLVSSNWSLTNSGMTLQNGVLKTHVVDVPFSGMKIKPTQLQYGTYQLDQLTLNGVLDLEVDGTADLFREGQHWKLACMPAPGTENAAYVRALPAMNKDLTITDFALYSNKTGSVNVASDEVMLHGLVKFYPEQIIADANRIKIPGLLDMGIPDVPLETSAVVYKRQGSSLRFGLQAYPIRVNTNGVQLDFNVEENTLTASGVQMVGTISEPGLYSMNVELKHNQSSTGITCLDGNEFKLGSAGNRKLTNIAGGMDVAQNEWQPFHFEGDLTNTTGLTGRLNFRVVGDVLADDQSVSVKNISTPFGSLNIHYDFDREELMGTMDEVSQSIGNAGHFSGTAQFAVGDLGWYFCGGAIMEMPQNPYLKKTSTAFVFADYPVGTDPYIKSTFETYAYENKLPSQFSNHLSGFFIDGHAELPVPYVPDIDVDLVVVSGELWVRIGGDFNLGMNFTDGPDYFRTGAEVYAHGHIGVGGSVGIACAGASLDARVTYKALGEFYTNGNWGCDASGTLKLTGSAYAGGGCCNSSCNRPKLCPAPCIKDRWSGSKTFGVRFHMGSDDNYFNVDF